MTRSQLTSAPWPLGVALASALLLGGCISLFPKQTPSQLYQFEAKTGAVGGAATTGTRVNLVLPPPTFPRAAAGDQMLSVTGDETAYLAGARWVSPAQVLFEESTRRAFAGRAVQSRLVGRGELGAADAFLRLDVGDFEVRYASPGAAPSVHVMLRGLLTHKNGAFAAERTFVADAPASDNRVGPIVAAYSTATEMVTTELLNWTDANAGEAARSPAIADGAVISTRTSTASSSSTTTVRRPPPR